MKVVSRIALCGCLAAALGAQVAAGQVSPVKRLMQEKLAHSQAILGAVVTADWTALGRESRATLAIVKDPAWIALITPETRPRTDAFALALQDLIDASDRRSVDDAVVAQVSMNLQCVRCHQLMARIAKHPVKTRG